MDNNDNLETQQPQDNMSNKQEEKSSWGPAIGLIIILILIIAGSFYFFGESDNLGVPDSENPSVTDIEGDLSDLQSQSDSDEVEDIEEDLDNTDLEDLDAELDLMEEELNQMEAELN